MKIGIVSDTHGFVENFKEVIQYFKKNGIETIIHLGDDWADTKILEKEKIPFLRVPGVYLFGHSHIPLLEIKEGIFFINPGHLKDEDKKGYPPSFALAEFLEGGIVAKIIGFKTDEIIKKLSFVYKRK